MGFYEAPGLFNNLSIVKDCIIGKFVRVSIEFAAIVFFANFAVFLRCMAASAFYGAPRLLKHDYTVLPAPLFILKPAPPLLE